MKELLNPQKALIFRIVHIDNLPWILDNGLHCRNAACQDPDFVSVGNDSLISARGTKRVPIEPGGTLGDYVPFYFTPSSIMLYNIITGINVPKQSRHDIVILISSLQELASLQIPFVFANQHAYPVSAEFFNSMEDIGEIDWTLLQSRDFKHDPDYPEKKERYQAEALAYSHVPIDALLGIACYNQNALDKVRHACASRNLGIRTVIRETWYFTS